MKNKPSNNLKIIKAIKERLKNLSVKRVASLAGFSNHQALYHHLDESRADLVNLDTLNKITRAIKQAEKEDADKAKQILQTLNQD